MDICNNMWLTDDTASGMGMSSEVPAAAAAAAAAVLAQRRRFPFNLPTLYSGKEWWWAAAQITVDPLYAQQCPTAA